MSENPNPDNTIGNSSLNNANLLPVDKRVKQSRDIAKWFVALSIVFALISISATYFSTPSSTSEADDFYASSEFDYDDTESWDVDWAPSDYTVWSNDSNIAWKWTPSEDFECDDYACISAQFISRDGCPNGLSVSLNWLDDNDSVVSYSSASLPSLQAMQTAQLKFDDFEDVSSTGQLSEINCG